MRQRYYWSVLVFWFVVFEAMAMQVRGPLLVSFQSAFDLSEGQLGLIAPAGTAGFLIAILSVGIQTGRINLVRVLMIGAVGSVLTTVLIGLSVSFSMLLAFILLQGVMAGVFRAIDRPILSHLYPVNRGRVFSIYTFVWAIGAAAAPIVVNVFLSIGGWRLVYAVLAVGFVVPPLLMLFVGRPDQLDNEEQLSPELLKTIVRRPAIVGMGLGMVFSGLIEGILFTWLPYYAAQFFPSSTANLLLSVYLASYIPGRLFYGYLSEKISYRKLLLSIFVLSVPSYLVFVSSTGRVMIGSIALTGFLFSGVFPAFLAYGVETVPEHSGPINAIATGMTFVGLSVSPALVGVIADVSDINTAMYVPFLFIFGSLVVTVLIPQS